MVADNPRNTDQMMRKRVSTSDHTDGCSRMNRVPTWYSATTEARPSARQARLMTSLPTQRSAPRIHADTESDYLELPMASMFACPNFAPNSL